MNIMETDIVKNKDLILRVNFNTLKVNNLRKKLIDNGWVIKEKSVDDKVRLRLYESEEELEWHNPLYESFGLTSDKAFIECMKVVQDWLKKLANE